MKKALNAWTVPGGVSFAEMFKALSKAGFEGVELNIDKDNASGHSLTFDTTKAELSEILALSEEYHLPIGSISTSLYGTKLGSPDAAERKAGQDILLKQLEFAAALKATGILVVPGADFDRTTLSEAYEYSFTAINELKPAIEGAKIKVGLENVWNTFFLSPFDMCGMIDRLDCEYIGAYFDAGNVYAFSRPEVWIETLGSRIFKIHVKDFARTGGVNSPGMFANLLQGNIDWKKVVHALEKVGYSDYVTAELGCMESSEYLYETTSKALDIILKR